MSKKIIVLTMLVMMLFYTSMSAELPSVIPINREYSLPIVDGSASEVLRTDGAGAVTWSTITASFIEDAHVTWHLSSKDAGSGSFFVGGFYEFASSDSDFTPAETYGTANSSKAAHVLFVIEASPATTESLFVAGTSITDAAVRTINDVDTVVILSSASADDYFESKKFIGQVVITKSAGGDSVNANYGWSKYYDHGNAEFTFKGFDITWLGGANDNDAGIHIYKHASTGWAFVSGGPLTPPDTLASLQETHVTEHEVVNGEHGAFKIDGINNLIRGDLDEGIMLEVTGNNKKTFIYLQMVMELTKEDIITIVIP